MILKDPRGIPTCWRYTPLLFALCGSPTKCSNSLPAWRTTITNQPRLKAIPGLVPKAKPRLTFSAMQGDCSLCLLGCAYSRLGVSGGKFSSPEKSDPGCGSAAQIRQPLPLAKSLDNNTADQGQMGCRKDSCTNEVMQLVVWHQTMRRIRSLSLKKSPRPGKDGVEEKVSNGSDRWWRKRVSRGERPKMTHCQREFTPISGLTQSTTSFILDSNNNLFRTSSAHDLVLISLNSVVKAPSPITS